VLELELHNRSDKFAFVPLDDYFDRKFAGEPSDRNLPPFTCLELGTEHRYYGGPANWFPLGTKEAKDRQWIVERQNAVRLEPRATENSLVCTDGNDDQLAETLTKYEGPLLWRIHVRCGPVPYKDKLVAATTVIGVEFTDRDYRPK
jgi:hypothetical protein